MKKIITVSIACVLMLCGAFSIAPSFTGEVSASETGEPADDYTYRREAVHRSCR